jgi:hypothetical protein
MHRKPDLCKKRCHVEKMQILHTQILSDGSFGFNK